LTKKAASASETSVTIYLSAWRNISEDLRFYVLLVILSKYI